jgi:aminopeptidase N
VSHFDLDLTVDFAERRLRGEVRLQVEPAPSGRTLRLDTRQLDIEWVRLEREGDEAEWQLGAPDPALGRALSVDLAAGAESVYIGYQTQPGAAALQWLEPAQTAGGSQPFLFTQSQAILARTWVPCQDTPAVRTTYSATVRVPPGLMALMSAENPTAPADDGVHRFTMPQPVPSYLLALAVGELEFRSLGPRSGVYAEPAVAAAAAYEFAEVEAMITAAERLYGPYGWGRYDLLVLPPSFPFGGMENPRLTFATPTILAGDRSLVALVAHELAHSWSGNLVTNADWNDFWLNEGFTSYFENRIMEEISGSEYATMLRALSLQDLEAEIERLGADSPDTRLRLDLAGRDPDDGMTAIAYDKGAALLRRLEEAVGRDRWDTFLRQYFEANAFRSITTDRFRESLTAELGDELPPGFDLDDWLFGTGLPDDLPRPDSNAFRMVEGEIARWRAGARADQLATDDWTTHEWLHFLRQLPADLETPAMVQLDEAFALSATGNSEILAAWLEVAIRTTYEPAYPALERFLTSVGRRKFLRPLYAELAKSAEGLTWAREVYAKARPGYHAIARNTVDDLLSWDGRG